MSTHLAASLFRNIYHLTQNGFTITELIDIIETYEKVHEENLIDDEIAQICILSNSNLDLWKYCIDVRQGNINNMNTDTCTGIPIIYECLQSTKSSLYDLDLFEYLIEKVDVVFDKKAAVQLKVDALHHYMVRLMSKLYNLQHSTENHRWTKIFLTLFSKGSRVSEKINERTAVDLMNQYSPYLDDFSEIINNQLRREQEDQKSSSVYISLI
ncbi:hypothetical protein C9374_012206 [Naegleria lovaniensis]|uniref:Uncharacterized protein n=1 Tax=Naegleria lovaniensis TaxID=51637 RepID=A0AA88KBW2_NAELO|nr:uncharacterized protein C9374_012206 [Naegleria lovaniensis]KAG2373340.1 hypothetical protein C9374_012206 [Naegleria lovaniensis]